MQPQHFTFQTKWCLGLTPALCTRMKFLQKLKTPRFGIKNQSLILPLRFEPSVWTVTIELLLSFFSLWFLRVGREIMPICRAFYVIMLLEKSHADDGEKCQSNGNIGIDPGNCYAFLAIPLCSIGLLVGLMERPHEHH